MKACKEFLKKDRFAKENSIELVECRPGYAKAQAKIEDRHLNGAGTVHGGLLFTLADFAFAAAVNSYGYVTLSINASISYFAKCEKGIIVAEARELARSEKLVSCDVDIRNEENTLLANFKGTAYITKQVLNS
jgi:acyl-CoA thioesterase